MIQKEGAKKPRGEITPTPNPAGLAQAVLTVAAVTIGKTYQQHVDAPVEIHVPNNTYSSFKDFLAQNSSESLKNTNIIICPGGTSRNFCGTFKTIRVPGEFEPDCRQGALNHNTNGPPGKNYGELNGFINDFGANPIAISKLLEVIPGLYDLFKVVYGDTFLLAIDRFSTRNKPTDFDLTTAAGEKNLKDNLHVDYDENGNGKFEKRDGPLPPLHTVKTPKGFVTVVILYQALDHSIPMGGSGIFPYVSPVEPTPYREDTFRIWGKYYDKTQVFQDHPYLHNTVPTQRAKTMLKGKEKGTFFVSLPNSKNKRDAYILFFVDDSKVVSQQKLNGLDEVVRHIRENEHLQSHISPEESKVYTWKHALQTLGRNPEFNTLIALFSVFQIPPVAYPSGKPIQLPLPPYAGPAYKLLKGEITPDEKLLRVDPTLALRKMSHPSKRHFQEIFAKFPDFKWATDPSTLHPKVLTHMFAPAQEAL